MEKERRERKANFSDNEVKQLLEGVGEEKDLIQSKLQSSVTVRKKKEAWRRILEKVNACSTGVKRTEEDCRKKWRDLKSSVIRDWADQQKTGGGAPSKTPYRDLIFNITGDDGAILHGIQG